MNIFRGKVNKKVVVALAVAVVGVLVMAFFALANMRTPKHNVFVRVGNMHFARSGHQAVLLQDGRVLIVGGICGKQNWFQELFNDCGGNAEIYDPKTQNFSLVNMVYKHKESFTATLLNDGRVLITGGRTGYHSSTDKAEIFDPKRNRFKSVKKLSLAKFGHTANLLPDGKVLILGGAVKNKYGSYSPTERTEIFDPITNKISIFNSMNIPRENHEAITLRNGEILITGGGTEERGKKYPKKTPYSASAEIYDPATGKFSIISGMNEQKSYHKAILLKNGKVLILGGAVGFISNFTYYDIAHTTYKAELYDPKLNKFQLIDNMNKNRGARGNFSTLLLTDGKVLITGGFGVNFVNRKDKTINTYPNNAEIYDPNLNKFIKSKNMLYPRNGHQMTLLKDNTILITGGTQNPETKTEIYKDDDSLLSQ